jgi:hypothetical protein
MPFRLLAFLIAASFVVVLYVVTRVCGTDSLIRGADGRPSTSKAQWWIWTAIVLFGYVAVFVERWLRGDPSAGIVVPQNLLVAMGFSGVSMVAAKAVTTTHVTQGLVDKTRTSTALGGIFTDDNGRPDLSKVQNIAFTAVAVIVYFVRLATQVTTNGLPDLVDIDPSLMLLMGLSHGSYIGAKLATRDVPPQPASSDGAGSL